MDTTKIDYKLYRMRVFLEDNPMQNVKNRINALKLLYKNILLMENEICDVT